MSDMDVLEAQAFGKRLRAVRQRRGLTQRVLGDLAAISRVYVTQIEGGDMPPVAVINRLARALGVSRAYLLGDEPDDLDAVQQERALRLVEEALEAVDGVPVPVVGRVPADSIRDMDVASEGRTVRILQEDLRGARSPKAWEVTGDCLQSLGILHGDVVIVQPLEPGEHPQSGKLCVVRIGSGFTLKRWVVTVSGIELCDGDGNVCHRLADYDDVEVLGQYVTFRPLAPR